MGLYRIQVRHEKVEAISDLMRTIGFPIVRTESQETGVCYFCINPKRSNKNWRFCITHERAGCPQYFTCGLSQLSKQIVRSLNLEGLFEKGDSE
jgi:hypothetical protein